MGYAKATALKVGLGGSKKNEEGFALSQLHSGATSEAAVPNTTCTRGVHPVIDHLHSWASMKIHILQ
jgi:hypothetical protein